MASFFVIRGRDNGQHFAIRGDATCIGRESSNQIKLNDTEVSRQHAVIRRTEEDQFEIRDLDSSNGSYVNSKRVTLQLLHSGDRVQVGRTLMIFTSGPDPHSTRSLDGVEIVSPAAGHSDLSQIRHAFESPRAGSVINNQAAMGDDSASGHESLAQRAANPTSLQEWEVVYQVSQAIRRTVDLDQLLTQVLDLIFQWIACDRGCVMMLDDVTGQLTPTYSRHRTSIPTNPAGPTNPTGPTNSAASPSTRGRGAKLEISRTILDYVTSKQEGVLTSNAQDDARWEGVESISDLGIYEAICVPMSGRYGLVGAIYVDTQVSPGKYLERGGEPCFAEQHLKLMIAIAGQAALAIEDTQFYRAMLQAERLATMGQTIATLSHHVKNILQGVSGGAYLLQDGLKRQDLEVVSRGWKIVERNQERISNLVMDMLSFSKEREPELRECDLGGLLQDIFDLMHGRASELAVDLRLRPLMMPLRGMLDPDAMHQAILNVVTNAIDASATAHTRRVELAEEQCQGQLHGDSPDAASLGAPPNIPAATVEIWAEHSAERGLLTIAVKDNGEGIAEGDVQRIFSPFESSKGARGTGLGLPVSQKILREHGGEILVESAPGLGSKFLLQWPCGNVSASDAEPVVGEPSAPHTQLQPAELKPASPAAARTISAR